MLRMWRDWYVRVFSISHYPDHHWYCEVVKRAGLPVKFSPLVSVTLGVIFGILYVQPLMMEYHWTYGRSFGNWFIQWK